MKQRICIIGFGRFGKTLYRLLENDFDIILFKKSPFSKEDKQLLNKSTIITTDLTEVYKSDIIFYAIPIHSFENVIKQHKKYFRDNHVLIDVLSVKMHPKNVLTKYLKGTKTQALLTHPMFGPDSSKNGFDNLPIILEKFLTNEKTYKFWKEYFENKKLQVIEMYANEHDKLAAQSQGVTHFIGRLLENIKYEPTNIDSVGAKKLAQVKEQTCNDTWNLFIDLQRFNPYTKHMRTSLAHAHTLLSNKILPDRIDKKFIIFGIQGGKGSFNEQALQEYIKKENLKNVKVKYLYTTEKVLKNLTEGDIDLGIFAISNATGGLVEESIEAMAKYNFTIVNDFQILISHHLMKRKDAKIIEINTIMAHPQVFKQCEQTLEKKYPKLKLVSGRGETVDTAKAASHLANRKLPNSTAILGPQILSDLYDLEIIDNNLQDNKNNLTRFIVAKR